MKKLQNQSADLDLNETTGEYGQSGVKLSIEALEVENSVLQFNRYTNRVEQYPRPQHLTTNSSTSHVDGTDAVSIRATVRSLYSDFENEILQYNPYAKRIEQYPRHSHSIGTNSPEKVDQHIISRATPKENNEITSGTNDTISRTRTGSSFYVNEGNLPCHNTKTRNDTIHKERIACTTQLMMQPENTIDRPKKRSRNDCSIRQSSMENSEEAMEESQGNEINVVTLKGIESSTDNDSTLVRYIAVDVETHDWCKWNSRDDYIGRIIQLAWVSYNVQGRVLEKKCHLIKPIGFEISRKAEQYHHITNKMALELGEDATVVLSEFINVLKGISDGGCVIAHNMKHEDCCFARNLTPEQLLIWENVPKVCTMTPRLLRLVHSDHYWSEPGLPRRWGLKLVDLHRLLCHSASGEDSESLRSSAHNALADACMCGEIFFEFKRKVSNETELWWQKDIAVGS
jgi:hypothetical protein